MGHEGNSANLVRKKVKTRPHKDVDQGAVQTAPFFLILCP